MSEPRFCLHCGAALETRPIDGEPRPACPACPYVCFDNPVAVAGVIVRRGGEVLLVRQQDFPQFVLVAGYLEAYESAEDAAVREMKEETGLDVVVERVLGTYSCRPIDKSMIFLAFGEPGPIQIHNPSDLVQSCRPIRQFHDNSCGHSGG